MCSGSVIARHTLSCGCASSRVNRSRHRAAEVLQFACCHRPSPVSSSVIWSRCRSSLSRLDFPRGTVRSQPPVQFPQRRRAAAGGAWRCSSTRTRTSPASRSTRRCLDDGRLVHLQPGDQLIHRALAPAHQVEDLPPPRLRQHLKNRGHPGSMLYQAYSCQGIYVLTYCCLLG